MSISKKINIALAVIALLALCFGICFSVMPRVSAAETPEIKPLVWYEFEDAENMGKDSMGNFDLTPVIGQFTDVNDQRITCLTQEEDTDGEKYAKFVSNRGEDGELSSNIGANLYAGRLGGAVDFSDLISGSFSVELTFRRDNTTFVGNHYVLACGRFNNAFQITPWKNCIEIQINHKDDAEGATDEEKQAWMEKNTLLVQWDTREWTTLLISADADTNVVNVYINGELKATKQVKHVEMTYKPDDYAFSLGAQCNVNGGSQEGYSTVDIKDCKVFDCALSADNAKQLYEGNTVTYSSGTYIDSIAALDTTGLDLFVTDVNTVENIMENVLPQTSTVTLSNNVQVPVNIYWVEKAGGVLYGYVQSEYANPKQLSLETEYGYTVRIEYDSANVAVTGVRLDGQAYTPGTEIEGGRHTVTFNVTLLAEGWELNDVMYYDISQAPLDDGSYSVTVNNGGHIVIDAGEIEYKITYYDGEERLFTSTYTASGDEALKTYEKEGYTFEGWYLDAALTQKVENLDAYRDNPSDLTLYAKTTVATDGNNDGNDGKGGCGGNVAAVSLAGGLTVLAGVCVAIALIRRKNVG